MAEITHKGGCSCGRTRYQLTGRALIVHACHCRMCQRLTGSSNAINVLIEADRVQLLSGKTVDILGKTPSGAGQVITRCASCFSAVWSEYRRFSKASGVPIRFVRAGTLDAPQDFPPDVHIYTRNALPHVRIAHGIPQFDAFYDLKKQWSDKSLRRLALAKADQN